MKKLTLLIRAILLLTILLMGLSNLVFAQCEPVCENGYVFEWIQIDTDSDGMPDTANTLEASLLLSNQAELESCGGEVTYSVHPQGDTPNITMTHYPLEYEDCNSLIQVEVAAWQDGNFLGSCPTYVFIQSNFLCEIESNDTVLVSGFIQTWCDQAVVGLPLYLNGDTTYTDNNGFYSFEVPVGGDYTIAPYYNEDYLNGVDTNDITAISDQITSGGFSSPYQMIAADANNSQSIATFDLVLLSQLILGYTDELIPPSWRFIPADYIFPNPENPWMESAPQVVNINGISENLQVDFIAIKTGDVDCSANPVLNTPGPATLQGFVFEEGLSGCTYGANDTALEGWIVEAASQADTYYATTESDGSYTLELPAGDYTLSANPPNSLWEPCSSPVMLSLSDDTMASQDIGFIPTQLCPFMEVSFSTLELIRCEQNTYQVYYANQGNTLAEDAYVEITFDEHMTVISSSVQRVPLGGQAFAFFIGDQPPGSSGSFEVQVFLSCDALDGEAHCLEARIFPDGYCAPTDEDWDGSKLEVEGKCTGDSIQFTIQNLGEDMAVPRTYIVIEDDLVMMQDNIKLDAGGAFQLFRPANGTTQRLEFVSMPGPYRSVKPNVSVEACTPTGVAPSLGYVTAYSNDSGYPFEATDCRENGTVAANAIIAHPEGLGSENSIGADIGIRYQINFQNTENGTLQYLMIQDQIPAGLNPGSIRLGASSHPCTFSMSETGLASFVFEDIFLPPASENETGSKGYVSFYLEQDIDNPNGLLLENAAAIYQNAYLPATTNYSWHTINSAFLFPDSALVSGSIYTENAYPVVSEIYLSSDGVAIDTTSGNGYNFTLPTGENYAIEPFRGNEGNSALTTFDLVLIMRQMLGDDVLSPYQIIAADVNNSGSVTIMDLIEMRKRILNITDSFSYDKDWRFIPADYVFPNPQNPWQEEFPEQLSLNPLLVDVDQDFIAIRVGDVDQNWQPLQQEEVENRNALPLFLSPEAHNRWSVDLDQPASLASYQIILKIPEEAKLEKVEPGNDVGVLDYHIQGSSLIVVWYNAQATAWPVDQPLFYLKGEGLNEMVIIDEAFSQAYENNGEPFSLQLSNGRSSLAGIEWYPNPADEITRLIGLPASGGALLVFDARGRLVLEQTCTGTTALVNVSALPAGAYSFRVEKDGKRIGSGRIMVY